MSHGPRFRDRLRAAVVVIGITLGILLLFFLQFAIPYWIGPVGLVVLGFVDAAIYLEMRRRRARRRRARVGHLVPRGRVDPSAVARRRRPLGEEFVATIGLLVFVVGISMWGVSLQGDPTGNVLLSLIGSVLLTIACGIWWPYQWRFYDWRTESEKYDTTDDR